MNLWEAEYNKPKNDADRLLVCAAGIRAMQHFGAIGWHGGGGDNGGIAQAVAIWSRMPRQALEWKDALTAPPRSVAMKTIANVTESGFDLTAAGSGCRKRNDADRRCKLIVDSMR